MSRILITGASRGVGRALAKELIARGHEVVATARNVKDLEGLNADSHLALDVNDPRSIASATDEGGPVDVIINNAAMTINAPLEAVPIDVARQMFETNVLGPLRLIQTFMPGMRQRRHGLIVNISSLGVLSAPPLQGLYVATKAALEKLSEVLQFEARHFGVRVVVIPLGGVKTEMTFRQKTYTLKPYEPLLEQQERRYEYYRKQGGGSPPEEVAAAIADVVEQDDPPLYAPLDGEGPDIRSEQARERARQGLEW
jgi:NAD(P)-dependent dehydrogenase (short-subunit alcohol dehydrogenase family)